MHNCVMNYLDITEKSYSEKIAIIDGKQKLTFRQLKECGQRIATSIINRSIKTHYPIAVYLPKGCDSLVGFIGILYSGNFYVPIDVKSPMVRVSAIMDNLQPLLVITSTQYVNLLQTMGIKNENIVLIETAYDQSIDISYDKIIKRLNQTIDTDPVYIMYTSGSTGMSKGVVIPHRGVIDYIDWAAECFNIGPDELIGSQSPFTFDNSTLDIYLCLSTGATLVIIPEQMFAFPATLMAYVNEMKINFIFWVPSVLVNVANVKVLDKVKATSLKKILFAGEVMPNKHLNYWRENIPEAVYANLYGPTEITVDCTYYIVDRQFADHEPLPIGVPCRNTDIIIMDEADGNITEPNKPGELCVRGSSLALGYWNDPEKSSAAFIQNPLRPHYPERIYRTGDIVQFNELGEIIFVGRKDSQIKHLGYRIELGEIETAALSLEEIETACVIYNKEKKEISLFFQAEKNISSGTIRQKMMQLVPKYMIPTAIYQLNKLPVNPNGKIDRVKLLATYL